MKKFKLFFSVLLIFFVSSVYIYAAGQAQIVVNDEQIESGEELGAYLVLDGDGTYDIYVAISGKYLIYQEWYDLVIRDMEKYCKVNKSQCPYEEYLK